MCYSRPTKKVFSYTHRNICLNKSVFGITKSQSVVLSTHGNNRLGPNRGGFWVADFPNKALLE